MSEYPKINSLWKRTQDKSKRLIVGDYSEMEYGVISMWNVEEKIDGTNIRISYARKSVVPVMFEGRTKDAHIPCHLLSCLQEKFQHSDAYDLMEEVFKDSDNVTLYGEGYGPKIQKGGGNYRSEPGFILFDVKVGPWWLTREATHDIAKNLMIPHAPFIGVLNEDEIVEYVKSKPKSLCSMNEQVMEGVVCRSEPLMLHRNHKPIMWKLKCKEFDGEL